MSINKKSLKEKTYYLLILIVFCSCSDSDLGERYPMDQRTSDRQVISNEMDNVLVENIIQQWYPNCLDTLHGGYLSSFDYRWNSSV